MIPKTLSRLAAVQSLFQSLFTKESLNRVALEFNEHRFNKKYEELNVQLNYDKDYYNKLILYIEKFDLKYDYEDFFSLYIKEKRPYKRLDIITKSILIVGASEIYNDKNIKKNIIINEYIEIAKGFLNKPEVSFINAILDKIYDSK
ncbi:MAG: hypothetical protein CMI95_00275 [Pelagibacteraceae bacterium]|nr:hypothetical protein [Pelagibacteraceae bacterium]|tara:strand:- start:8092 stop:8529 length:438 start_codon:yes stop_codon:yes gene_type:complete